MLQLGTAMTVAAYKAMGLGKYEARGELDPTHKFKVRCYKVKERKDEEPHTQAG